MQTLPEYNRCVLWYTEVSVATMTLKILLHFVRRAAVIVTIPEAIHLNSIYKEMGNTCKYLYRREMINGGIYIEPGGGKIT